jgi:peptidoglycan/LPS O-acetylase OafA/YrhL
MRSVAIVADDVPRSAVAQPVANARRIEGIEALRAFAALGVLTWHVWSHPTVGAYYGVSMGPLTKVLDNGRVGVAMFFVLSGFLLYRPFAAAVIRDSRFPSVGSYFVNRALRILPAYWVVLLVVATCLQRGLLDRPAELLANMFFLQDFFPHYVPGVFTGYGIAPAWSLCVEVIFYLCLPVLALGALGLRRRARIAPVPAVLAPVAVMVLGGVVSLETPRVVPLGGLWRMGFPEHMHWFGMGMLVAVLRVLYEDGAIGVTRPIRWGTGASAIVIALVALKLTYAGELTFEEEQSLLTVSCALLLALVVLPSSRSHLLRVLGWRPLVYLGLISYSIFLWHEPVLRTLRADGLTKGGPSGVVVDLVVLTAVSVCLASVTYFLVEKPALSAKGTLARRRGARAEPPEWAHSAP